MLGYLYRLLFDSFKVPEHHRCEWELLEKIEIFEPGGIKSGSAPYALRYILRCKHCGDIINKDFR